MGTAVIGRILAASLHQAISEILPLRLEFYESWLSAKGFKARRVYVAGVRAVFSFLRREEGEYDAVVRRAGELAAHWMFEELPPIRRRLLLALPRGVRVRAALGLAKDLARETWDLTRVRIRWRRGVSTVTMAPSLFCDLREAAPTALCGFYAAGVEACLRRLGLDAEVRIDECQAQGHSGCTISVRRAAPSSGSRAAAAVAVLLAGAMTTTASAQLPGPAGGGRVLVMPFENATRQPRLSWLGEGASILLADDLRMLGEETMTRDERLHAFDRLQVPPLATLSRATVIRIGELVGAGVVVVGSLALDQDAVVLTARRIHLDSGRLGPEASVRGALGETDVLFRELAARLWGGETEGPPPATAERPAALATPLPAFEQYVKGLLADTPSAQVPFLIRAIQLHPAYDEARVALSQSYASAGDYRAAIEALRPIGGTSPLGVEASLLTAVAHIVLREYPAAWRVLSQLQGRAPSALVLNDLGVVRLRAQALPADAERATWYFSQARTLDPLDSDYLFNLGYAHWLEGDPDAASYWLREAVRLSPTDAAAHALLARVLQSGGHAVEAARELTLAQRLSAAFDGVDLRSAPSAAPRGLERLKETFEPPRAQRIDAALEMVGQREQRELARFYLEHGRRLFEQENDRAAESELTRALYLSPYDAEAHLLLGRCYVRTGRLRDAVDAFKVSIWSQDTVAARVALAEAYLEARDTAGALEEVERALALDPESVPARKLLERIRQGPGAPL